MFVSTTAGRFQPESLAEPQGPPPRWRNNRTRIFGALSLIRHSILLRAFLSGVNEFLMIILVCRPQFAYKIVGLANGENAPAPAYHARQSCHDYLAARTARR